MRKHTFKLLKTKTVKMLEYFCAENDFPFLFFFEQLEKQFLWIRKLISTVIVSFVIVYGLRYDHVSFPTTIYVRNNNKRINKNQKNRNTKNERDSKKEEKRKKKRINRSVSVHKNKYKNKNKNTISILFLRSF